jgi:GntR family transcriptional repressor for pyruvate dehydrogenase complex
MSFETIKRESTLEIIVQQIKQQIKNGILKPGEKLPSERELANLLGVSRTSVREAIQALAYSGYLEVIQGKGTYVLDMASKYEEIVNFLSEFSNYSVEYLMEARMVIEGEFARLAALNATQEEINLMQKIYRKLSHSKDANSFFVKDLELHLTIAKATHNPIFNGIMKIIGELIYKETQSILEASIEFRERNLDNIKDLVQAIKERDAEKAKQLMVNHFAIIKSSLE